MQITCQRVLLMHLTQNLLAEWTNSVSLNENDMYPIFQTQLKHDRM